MTGKRERGAFIVYPNVLFSDVTALRGYDHVFLVEEPLFFGGKRAVRGRDYDIGKMKLAYMRASMKAYGTFLKEHKFRVSYVDYDDVKDYGWLSASGRIGTYQIIDFELIEKVRGIPRLGSIEFEATSLFPLSLPDICSYFDKGDSGKRPQRYVHGHFYKWAKSKLGILEDVKSFDTENRRPLPRGHELEHHTPRFNDRKPHSAILEEATRYISKHSAFKNNIGSYERLCMYPLDHAGAKKLFLDFLDNRLDNFGPYQDAIDKDEPILYHSFCSTVLNNGLLSSDWVVEQLKKIQHRKKLPMRSLEAYVRQLCWRMWEVGIYLCFYDELRTSNYFHSTRRLKWEKWRGKRSQGLDIEPVDGEIEKAVAFGYAAHIPRLMVFLNIFVMLQVRPEDVVRWFMEIVSMDATIYFMWAIVTTMGAYNLRFMQKPYVSTSAYLLKMSNYPKGEWCETFTALFYDFLCRNKSKLKGSCSIYLRNLAHFERKTPSDQARIKKLARSFRDRVTS